MLRSLQLARLLLYKEHWYGTAEAANGNLVRKSRLLDRQSDTPADSAETVPGSNSSNISMKVLQLLPSHKFDVPVISMSRPQPQQLTGRWNVFVMAATPIVEENPDTLQVGGNNCVFCWQRSVLCSNPDKLCSEWDVLLCPVSSRGAPVRLPQGPLKAAVVCLQ